MRSTRRIHSTRRVVAAVAVALLMAAACSGDGGGRGAASGTTEGEQGGEGSTSAGSAVSNQATDEWLESLVPWGFRGAVGLVEDGEVVLSAGFGPRDPARADDGATIGPDTRFAIGSITKDLVDIAVLLLEHRGALRTGDPLETLLPSVPADKAAITVEQLMSHNAGFAHVHGDDDEQIGKEEALARIFGQALLFPPGTDEAYSNSGYTVLAAIIEEVSGRGFQEFLREEIFVPTGMASTGFRGEPVPPGSDEAVGWDDGGHAAAPSGRGPVGWTLQGNGGIASTVRDLLAFDAAVCDVLPREVVAQLPTCAERGGFGTAGGGSEYSHTATIEEDLDRRSTLVVLSADWTLQAEEVAFALLDGLAGGELADVPTVGEVDPAEIAAAVGTYRSDDGAVITVVEEDVGIRLVSEDGHALDDLFSLPDQIPDIAPVEEVVRFAQSPSVARQLAESGEQTGWPAADPELGPLVGLEPIGVAPVDGYEPQTFLRARFERGSRLTAWVFGADGEWLFGDLDAAPPGVGFRPDQEGGFVSFTLRDMPIADHVTVRDGVMKRISIDGRSTAYRRSA